MGGEGGGGAYIRTNISQMLLLRGTVMSPPASPVINQIKVRGHKMVNDLIPLSKIPTWDINNLESWGQLPLGGHFSSSRKKQRGGVACVKVRPPLQGPNHHQEGLEPDSV